MSRSGKLYRRLLRLYPSEFRGEFGSAMERDFIDEYGEAADRAARRRLVLRAFIDVLVTAPGELMRGMRQDIRYALRLYGRTPAVTVVAIVVLATGLAFVTSFLSLYVDLALRPHPGFEQSNGLATVSLIDGRNSLGLTYQTVEDMTEEMTSIDSVAWIDYGTTLIGPDREALTTAFASVGLFDGIRPRLALGRGFLPEEHAPESEPVALLSYRYWQQEFNGNRAILGTSIEITKSPGLYMESLGAIVSLGSGPETDSAQYRIVGILAEPLSDVPRPDTAVWLPAEQAFPLFMGDDDALRSSSGLALVRLGDGVSVSAMLNEFNDRYASDARFGISSQGIGTDAAPGVVSNFAVRRDAKRQLELFLFGSLLIALVAAVNVSLFLLSRSPGRRRELGIRLAVGAPVRRIARQLATESGLFVFTAAVSGLVFSFWLARILQGLPVMREAAWVDVSLFDWRVLGLATIVIVLLALLVALAPILSLRRQSIAATSHHATARASLGQRLASAVQIAVAGTVGGAAIGFGWYVGSMVFGDPGFEVDNRFMIAQAGMLAVEDMNTDPYVELARRREVIEAIPGVSRVGFGNPVPGGSSRLALRRITNDNGNEVRYYDGSLSPEYAELLGFRFVYGRAPEGGESGVAVVTQSFAREFWGHENVVGEQLPYGRGQLSIVGVLEDVALYHPAAVVDPFLYTYISSASFYLAAVIETSLSAADLQLEIDRLVAEGALEIPVSNLEVQSLKALRNGWIAADRARGMLTITAAVIVVGIAAFGLYGTQRYLVAAGRREYAIRSALGAGPASLGRLVLWRGLRLGLPGLFIAGLLTFITVVHLRDEFLSQGISPGMVTIWTLLGLIVLLLAASLAPARIARNTQPAALLRED